MFEELGDGFTLLDFGAPERLAGEFRRAANTLGIPFTIIKATCVGEREGYGASLVLVRPDQFVAWVSNRTEGNPAEILRRAVGADP